MAKNLVIVESPAKAKTIKKFLGRDYEVMASGGHVRDLPRSQMGVDVANDFEPKYITIRGKGELLASLRKEVKKATHVYLATDPDREGEAISWHLKEALKLGERGYQRITFNEITKNAVKNSIKEGREIDMDLVDAQQARRILDRMVGYSISPVLWKKVKRGLSAGRVQSVALRLICDREAQIEAFLPEEYWSIEGSFSANGKTFDAKFYGDETGKLDLKKEEDVQKVLGALEHAKFHVLDLRKSERVRNAPLPFTTSTLQQEASRALNFSTQKTMRIAQQLYEGVDIKGHGTVGLISYLRTDSTRISDEAAASARELIAEQYGPQYVGEGSGQVTRGNGNIQDAHEAIRPTYREMSPTVVKESLSRDQFRLYQLIWRRFLASRMQAARYEMTSAHIEGAGYVFTASASKLLFDGFLAAYTDEDNKREPDGKSLAIEEGQEVQVLTIGGSQHFTQPPAHYTEASLVKTLEEQGIGRPSTYAPTITTILARKYITKENKNLYVTDLGQVVNDIMVQEFPEIVDVEFTVNMEALLDGVEEGEVRWKSIVRNFYPDLMAEVDKANEELEKIEIADEVTDEKCELCGANLVIKYGPHGKFLACPNFPACRFTKPYLEKIGVKCPKCGGELVIRNTQKGRRFYGCENGPTCDFMSWQRPSSKPCPVCGGLMVEKGGKLVCIDPECGEVVPTI